MPTRSVVAWKYLWVILAAVYTLMWSNGFFYISAEAAWWLIVAPVFNTYFKDLIPDLVRIVNLLKYIGLLDSNITCRVSNELSFKPSV